MLLPTILQLLLKEIKHEKIIRNCYGSLFLNFFESVIEITPTDWCNQNYHPIRVKDSHGFSLRDEKERPCAS